MTAQRNSSKLLWGIIGSIVLIVIAVYAFFSLYAPYESGAEPTPASEVQTIKHVSSEALSSEATDNSSASEPFMPSSLISTDVLEAPIPKNPSLAKEELAKLEDIQKQLLEQEQILKEQNADADQLIKLKEEQIKLLEAQLNSSS